VARVDYEAAWTALQAEVASKPGHGRAPLLTRMAELAAEHTIPEGLMERAARIFGLSFLSEIARSQKPETEAAGGRAEPAPDKPFDPGPPTAERSHSGDESGEARNGVPAEA